MTRESGGSCRPPQIEFWPLRCQCVQACGTAAIRRSPYASGSSGGKVGIVGGESSMTSPVTVSERDLLTLLGIVGDQRSDLPAAGLPPSLLAELKDQIPCDQLVFTSLDAGRQIDLFSQDIPDDGDEVDCQLFWKFYWDSIPCSYPDRTGDLRSVTKPSDFYSVRQWHSTGMYSELIRRWGHEHEMLLCLPAGHLRTVRMIFWRGPGPDFAERDPGAAGAAAPPPVPGLPGRRTPPPPHPPAHPPAAGTAALGRRWAYQRPDRPAPRRDRENRG